MSDTIQLAVILIPCLIVAIVFHEVAHGFAALLLGDPTAREQRRLSLNPLRHVDPIGTLLVPGALALFGGPVFGWAKPVPVNFRRLRNPRLGMILVAAAGPGTNFLLAALAAAVLGMTVPNDWSIGYSSTGLPTVINGIGDMSIFPSVMLVFILLNIFLALFNLLPIPPFDGSHIVEGLLPRSLSRQYAKLRQLGMLLFIILIAAVWVFPNAGILARVIGPPVNWLMGHYLQLAQAFTGH